MQRLHSFGFGSQSGNAPEGQLLVGNDGFLYGAMAGGGTFGFGTVFKIRGDGSGYTVVHSFGATLGEPAGPLGGVIRGSDGALYGTTYAGGAYSNGAVFKVNIDGTGYATLYSFHGSGDGKQPRSAVIQAADGALYGTTSAGGTSYGTLFKLNTDGTGFALLHTFTSGDGQPYGGVLQGRDGSLYGTTVGGGIGYGTVYKIGTNGSGYSAIYNFQGPTDGSAPSSSLIQGTDGLLYGTAETGGTNNNGTVFRVSTNGTSFAVLHTFVGSDGSYVYQGLIQGMDGLLYGTTGLGGTNGQGVLFKLATNGGNFAVLHNFGPSGSGDGSVPVMVPAQATNGMLYGTTQEGGITGDGTIFTISTNGSSYAILAQISQSGGDGQAPGAGPLQAADGALYGTTSQGGTYNTGVIYRENTNGTGYSILYTFSYAGLEGQNPSKALLQGQDGALYGCANSGGGAGHGTVFRLNPDGSGFTAVHDFSSVDGAFPQGITQASDGLLYGSTLFGEGTTNQGGTLFKVSTNGTGYAVIHAYSGSGNDGDSPFPPIQGRDGVLYGTTADGGTNSVGTIFSVHTDGTGYTILYQFGSTPADGSFPNAPLIQGMDGALYGITYNGGSNNAGTIFRIAPDGSNYSIVHHLVRASDGAGPVALLQGSDGLLYGTAYAGGLFALGTAFSVSTNGYAFANLYNFPTYAGDGTSPVSGLVEGSDGAFYGSTSGGGDGGFGTVFRLTKTPSPIITQPPASLAVYPYAPASFSVQVSSSFPLSYQWLFNSTPVTGATGTSLSFTATPAQFGGYSVIAANLYGSVTSTVATLSMLAPTQALQSVVVLHNFGAAPGDGQWPMAGLMQATNGQLFGTTYGGGTYGNGTVFLLNTNGSGYTTRAQFTGLNGDAARPEAALIQGGDGALYGTAADGGAFGYGAVYQIANPSGAGAPVLIHSFGGSERADGSEPYAALLQLSDGALYGTTVLDGASGYGTLFRLSTDGATYSLRNSFSAASAGGIHPYAGLFQGADGALYGTTYSGGAAGYGTVFRLANPPSGPAPQWLHSFTNSAGDGGYPYAGVAQSSDGTLYGTTWAGGAAGAGTVFGLNADGSGYAVRVNFTGTNGSGANPYAGVVVGNDGALYGTTYSGGAAGYGTVFRVRNPAGAAVLEYVHSFTNGDGAYPVGGLLQAADGSFYGTTSSGGAAGEGTVYEFAFDPRIATQPLNRIVAVGASTSFSVVAAGRGPFTYQWLFNGNPLNGATNATLTLSNVTTNQAGVYAVVVFGAGGTVTSAPASLGVVGPPVFTSVARLADGNVRLTLSVVPNANYSLQTSGNLVSWAVQTNVFAASATIQIADLTATNAARRFYRAVWLP